MYSRNRSITLSWLQTHISQYGERFSNCRSLQYETDLFQMPHFFTHVVVCLYLKISVAAKYHLRAVSFAVFHVSFNLKIFASTNISKLIEFRKTLV